MEELMTTAQALLDYIEDENVCDTVDDGGGGYVDYSQSSEFKNLIDNLQHAITSQ